MNFRDTVAIALDEMAKQLSPTSMPTWLSHSRAALRYWTEEREVLELDRLAIQKWIDWRAQTGVKASTIGHELCFLSRLWRVHEDRGLDRGLNNPFQRLHKPRKRTEKRKIAMEVVHELATRLTVEDWQLVLFTLLTMLRRLEVFRIEPAHIVPDSPDEHGRPRWKVFVVTSKTGRSRFVALCPQAAEVALLRVAHCKRNKLTFLFGGQGEDRYKAACSWAKRIWYPVIKALGQGGHFHGLRHRGAHLAWRAGAPIEAVSTMLGHSNLVQTQHYLGITEDTMWRAADRLAIIEPPAMPRPGLADPAPTTPPFPPPVLPDPERESEPARLERPKANDWIFSM